MAGEGEIACKWEITDYKQYQDYKHGQFIQSPEFSIETYSWLLRFYPCGETKSLSTKNTISVIAQSGKVMADFSLSILDVNGAVLKQKRRDENSILEAGSSWSVSNMIVPMDNKFVILCKIKLYNPKLHFKQQFEKFEHLINNKNFSDVKFIVGIKQLHAHKVILASNSEVFAAMFQHDMKENVENVVKIEDISYEILHELLRFIYSGKVSKINHIAKKLLIAADKYQILELKSICEKQLSDDLSINNAIDYLDFSDAHDAAVLKKSAIHFIVKNLQDMIELEEFNTFMNLNAALVRDILRELCSKLSRIETAQNLSLDIHLASSRLKGRVLI